MKQFSMLILHKINSPSIKNLPKFVANKMKDTPSKIFANFSLELTMLIMELFPIVHHADPAEREQAAFLPQQ